MIRHPPWCCVCEGEFTDGYNLSIILPSSEIYTAHLDCVPHACILFVPRELWTSIIADYARIKLAKSISGGRYL